MTTLDGREVRGHHPQRVNCGLLVSWSPVTPKGGAAERARSSRNQITHRGWFVVRCRSDTPGLVGSSVDGSGDGGRSEFIAAFVAGIVSATVGGETQAFIGRQGVDLFGEQQTRPRRH
jgi:hypothetical protein